VPHVTDIQALAYIEALDFTPIINKMISESYPLPRWTIADAQTCERLYKNFLILNRKYPDENLVPTKEIDEFWHNHILDTRKYTEDCLAIFGHYKHHEPGPALLDEKTQEQFTALFKRTQELYFKEFSEEL
jgi:hypothetical protein